MTRYNERVRDVNADLQEPLPTLAPCPCGEEAVWYKTSRPSDASSGKHLSAMGASDFDDNLCEECFASAFGGGKGEREGWVKTNG